MDALQNYLKFSELDVNKEKGTFSNKLSIMHTNNFLFFPRHSGAKLANPTCRTRQSGNYFSFHLSNLFCVFMKTLELSIMLIFNNFRLLPFDVSSISFRFKC